ncbi:pentaheme c-type cytochrome TorC [Pantoea sp. BIGb0393]|uniref:Cytochrome c-type protein n=1 Tax=Pantoea nemavictus TaxID=2726955 RepID=A0ABU8PTX0_9GAMM|nr:pentaheme c-type cytochrome TorC [Pantoea nemavictus]MBA0036536.1 pentaheme c-type cytochrome TorC [Pantoea nemavictus]
MKTLWKRLRRPSARWSVLAILLVGIVIGLAVIVVPHTGITLTSSTEFCISCHGMQQPYKEYKQSTHFRNPSGVRAECRDCHIPRDIPGMLKRKLEASNDLYQALIARSIDTPEKFEAKRLILAEREWKRMKESNSAVCRGCHNYDAMDHTRQKPEAARQMSAAALENRSCIDCHKGITHQLPDMSSGFRKQFEEMRKTADANSSGDTLFALDMKPIFANKTDSTPAGSLLPASEVQVLKRDGDWLQVQISGWTETQGRQRVLSLMPGKRIFVSSIRDDLQKNAKTLETTTVAATNVEWSKLQTTAWMQKGDMVNDSKPIWAYASALYSGTCNQCHGAPDKAHFDANGWIGTLNGMIGFTSLDKREERTLLKYLQLNASDTGGAQQKH